MMASSSAEFAVCAINDEGRIATKAAPHSIALLEIVREFVQRVCI
jgi:hypothetical protein